LNVTSRTGVLGSDLLPGLAPGRSSGPRKRPSLAWLGAVPFFAYAVMFLFIPAATVMIGAFKGEKGGFTFSNVTSLVSNGTLRHAYRLSIEVSLVTAVLGAFFGLLLAYACVRKGTPAWIRSAFTTFSGVAANFGGIPLAFAFIATLGTLGIVTQFFQNQLGINLYANGFSLFTKTGVEITYLYFQIPLMFLVIAPALDGLRHEWREAASNLGASTFQFWRSIGLPILFPSLLGAIILLFGNAFAAYATAYALASSSLNLVPILIGADLRGNVYTNPHEGQALAFGMFVVLAVMMVIYVPLQRRASRWAK
jgi:putative spermidine/putrescine transport system permease protein